MIDFNSMKKESFDDASNSALNVLDEKDKKIASLVPIGNWALQDDGLLNSFANWRKIFMPFFLTQFTASKQSTHDYLKELSIAQRDRIFFAIYVNKTLVGHMGLSNITDYKAELDNVVRGVPGGPKYLMYFSEKTMLKWAFSNLKVRIINSRVMSKNLKALSLHGRFGFKLKERHFLKKVLGKDTSTFEICEENVATEKFFLDIIELSSIDFINATHSSLG